MTRATTPHQCPHCRCAPPSIVVEHGVRMDTAAPFFHLVALVSAVARERTTTPTEAP